MAVLTFVGSSNLVIILGFMQISKKVPFENENVLNGVRAMYILSNVIIVGIYLYVQAQINKKNGTLTPVPQTRDPHILYPPANPPPQT